MKCIAHVAPGGVVKKVFRVEDTKAYEQVGKFPDSYVFIPKSLYKKHQAAGLVEKKKEEEETHVTHKRATARKRRQTRQPRQLEA